MARLVPAVLTLLTLTAACAAPAKDDEGAELAPIANAADSIPIPPSIVAIQTGRAADSTGFVTNVAQVFGQADTVVISTATRNVGAGATIEVRLLLGAKQVAAGSVTTTEPGADGRARYVVRLTPSPTWAVGRYQVEALLDGASFGFQELSVEKPQF